MDELEREVAAILMPKFGLKKPGKKCMILLILHILLDILFIAYVVYKEVNIPVPW